MFLSKLKKIDKNVVFKKKKSKFDVMTLEEEYKKIERECYPERRKKKRKSVKKTKKTLRNPALKRFSLRQLKDEIQARTGGGFDPKFVADEYTSKLSRDKSVLSGILDVVSTKTRVSVRDIVSKNRMKEIVMARHLYFYISYRVFEFTSSRIGAYVYRDHATVLHGCSSIEKKMIKNRELEGFVNYLIKYCKKNKIR